MKYKEFSAMATQHRTFAHKAALALLSLTVAVVALYLMRPIYDPDFFWHLKTGQWILQHQSLPAIDPFSLNPPPANDLRASFLLTSYWFSQVIYAAFYSLGGWWGIALLRLTLAVTMAAIFALRFDLRQPAKVSLLLLLAVQILEVYPLERPQAFSFAFFAALLILLDRYREQGGGNNRTGTFAGMVALLMLAWANMHGAFFVGQVTLLLFLVMEGIKFLSPAFSPLTKSRYVGLGLIVLAGLVASCVNPNPINSFKILLNIGDTSTFLYSTNMEYYSPFRVFREYGQNIILLNWMMMGLVVGSVLTSFRRQDIAWLTLLAGTAFMGCQHARYMPFFLVAADLFLGKCRFEGAVGTFFKTLLVVSALLAVFSFSRDDITHFAPFVRGQWDIDQSFPGGAADFVVQNNLSGPVYNTYLWGGYLIWRLGPERKIFFDGRALDASRYQEYLRSTIGTQSTKPFWKDIFQTNGIQTAIVKIKEPSGQMNPLAASLRQDSEWSLVFMKGNAAVFVRK